MAGSLDRLRRLGNRPALAELGFRCSLRHDQ
jgi:hypothetical protein